jgi:thiamine transport system ATP-binding protein
MLKVENLRLEQSDFSLDATFSAKAGERLASLGPSGAGKSSLLAALGGFFAPTSGRILWEGQDLTDLPPAKRPISFLFQDQNLFAHLSVEDNLWLALSAGKGRKTPEQQEKILAAL